MGRRSIGRRIVLGSLCVGALVGAFVVGRVTAPDAKPSGPDCSRYGRVGASAPDQFLNSDGMAYLNMCEVQAARGDGFRGVPAGHANVYAQETGSKVVAWYWTECGFPEGVVAKGHGKPTNCGASVTTGPPPTT